MENTEIKSVPFTLPNKKVIVKHIKRARGMVKDPDSWGFSMIPGSYNEYCPPTNRNGGGLICPLNKEEIEFFEDKKKSGMHFSIGDLSPHAPINKDGKNYWATKKAKVKLTDQDMELDLSDPADYLRYKILLTNTDYIADSWAEGKNKPSYIYAIIEEEEIVKETASLANKQKEAWKFFGKIEDSTEKMSAVLRSLGKSPSRTASTAWLQGEISKIINDSIGLNRFLDVANDPHFDIKTLIREATGKGSLVKRSKGYFTPDGDPLAQDGETPTLESAVNFLVDNQEAYLTLKASLNKKETEE